MEWRQVAVSAGVATVLAFLIASATGALHGAPASAGRSAFGAVAAVVSPSQTSAPGSGCPYSGPFGALNTGETVGVLVVVALAGIGGGIVIGRRFLNPQPLPPGIYAPGSGTSGGGAGKTREETWTDGGKTAGDDITRGPALNPQPLPPGIVAPSPSGGPGTGGGGNKVSVARKAGGGNTPGQEFSDMEGESKS